MPIPVVRADFYDGRSTRIRPVELSADGSELVVRGDDVHLRVPLADLEVDERLGRAPRRLRFGGGGVCEVRDLEALDGLLAELGHRDGATDRLQRQSRYVLLACIAFLGLALAFVKWGLPWAAAFAARRLPPALSATLSAETLKLLDGQVLLPSRLDAGRRRTLEEEFHALRLPEGGTAASALLFRRSPQLGANAFTLPDGSIILLDDLVTDLGDDRRILAVLAHELGHAHAHHGLRLLLQSSAMGALMVVYLGDVSNLLAGASAAVLQARYSQDFERQADDYGASILSLNSLSPALLADALEKLAAAHPAAAPPGYLSSHPPTDERIRHLRARGP